MSIPASRSRKASVNSLPALPSTYDLLCECHPNGLASIVSFGVDNCGKPATPYLINEGVKYYEDNMELLQELTYLERKSAIKDHLANLNV
jgi:hypothetical protein